SDVVGARRAVEIGVEQIDLTLIGEFEVGVAEPADDDDVGACWWGRAAGHGRLIAVAGIWNIGRGGRSGPRKTRAHNSCNQRRLVHKLSLPVRYFQQHVAFASAGQASGATAPLSMCAYAPTLAWASM